MVEIHLGDCLDVLWGLPASSVDFVLADTPFGLTRSPWDVVIPFAPMWEALAYVLKPRAAVCLFGVQPFTSRLVMSNEAWYRHSWVWVKNRATGHLNAKKMPMRGHEDVLVFGEVGVAFYPQMSEGHVRKVSRRGASGEGVYGGDRGSDYDSTSRYPRSDLYFDGVNADKRGHPNEKPVELLQYLMRNYSQVGDVGLLMGRFL